MLHTLIFNKKADNVLHQLMKENNESVEEVFLKAITLMHVCSQYKEKGYEVAFVDLADKNKSHQKVKI